MKKALLLIACLTFGFIQAQDYSQIIKSYLGVNRSQLGLQPQDIENLNVNSHSFSKSLSAENVYVTQLINGIPVVNSISSFVIKGGEVNYAKVGFVVNANQKVNTTTASISASQAINSAASILGVSSPSGLQVLETVSSNSFIFNNGSISQDNIPVKLVYELNENNTLRLAWDLSIYYLDGSHYYSVRVDAISGDIISKNDWVVSCTFGERPHDHVKKQSFLGESVLFESNAMEVTSAGGAVYRVFPLPTESPNHGTDQLVSDPANAVASPFGWHDNDGVAGAEFTITRGNNVIARDDIDGNNTGGLSPDGGATLTFDFPYQFDTAPVNMLDAATTNLFYWNNIMHDVWYQYGFDEASGNFQDNNYGNGGNGNDFVDAQAQDGGGTNNANFSTPPDGNNGRMQMFLWSPAGPAGDPLTINNGPLMGDYTGVPATFGAPLPEDIAITTDLALVVDDNAGASVDENDACDMITNGTDLDGKIVVIRRGECEFGFKILAAENEGAVAVIMVNNVPDAPIAMGPGDFGDQVTIPGIMVSQADGDAIIAALLNGDTVNGSLINAGPYNIDGDLDNGIIAHEYGHGISNRLTGGPSAAGCLGNEEQMGEGWSDWFGLMLTMQSTDTRTDINGIGTYATGEPTDGGGIREAPYSTDFSINDYTYDDIKGNVSVPHGVGFVWATMLWEMTWDLVDEYGFDADFYNGTGGNNIAMQLVIDGLKLQGCNPGYIDGRDAILEADLIANGGANQCLIWGAFARRGLGVSASQGSSNNLFDGTEAYDEPTTPNCLLANGDRGSIDDNIIIFPNPSNGQVNIRAVQNGGAAVATIYDINGRKMITQDIDLTSTATLNASSLSTGVYILTINGSDYTHTTKLIIE
ncbi:peptidase M36 [Patiriisocius marinistellae]|uniref:Peptidase M36 n=1 Tax=Patiriisocius marinistellae TaxID=2494560 RepID=A0A5J4FYF6_9FLAO|nr:T9SS-dependent M36 family metallopeptidase [Patiriisocius marinistellae]GEQ85146.1 peptidase M36 [Patiriisocius marinistellae]